ncbi:cation:proton antiporter [Massilia sp. PAMC28688]|uniref:cation:proton antiporter n=1 Tax=Massilia sp. PAMC28688 TaxID=2861283 RepID=UPI001C6253B5|nr:cation:proton antiporter [Massilia sp. PAMC28688]QYF95401.1 cation:proton antiporter [Massilia sp. PAMC28688]
MTTIHWFILIGSLMLARGLAATTISRSPFTSAIVYLGVGLLLGPVVLNLFSFDPIKESHLLETLTEIAVLISLFSAGVKMPVPIDLKRWAPALRLAFLSMSINVGLVAAFAYYVLNLPLGAGVLLGAVLAPTDPVLATDVQVRHPDDRDKLRFTLTCEAGMNDGTAFPFVMLGLGLLGAHELGEFGWRWLAIDVIWAIVGAVALGALGGAALGKISWMLRGKDPKHEVLDDFVGLGMIAVVYGVCILSKTYGFLAIFAAGVALRQTELVLSGAHKDRQGLLVAEEGSKDPSEEVVTVSAESLVFKEHLERLSELTLVLLLGGMVSIQNWNWQTVSMGLFLFFVARPVSVALGLWRSDASLRIRAITGWFGVRGIGSIYYLMYAINHGLPRHLASDLIQLTIVVVMMSIVLHGTTVTPLLDKFWPTKKSKIKA